MENEVLTLKKAFKALAALIVFLISFSIPVLTSLAVQEQARNMRIKMDMGQIRNWAEVYKLENKTYRGFQKDPDLERALEDIKAMEGEAEIFVKSNSYCVKVLFKKGSFCVDNSGYLGKDNGICSSDVIRCN